MENPDLIEMAAKVAMCFVPFLFALCFHEFAHAWVAKMRGDRTADLAGRLTLNPLAHLDVMGTVVVPILGILFGGFLFGWAKPVPVNDRNLKRPVQDMFWVALAGPLSNVLLAAIAAIFVLPAIAIWMSHGGTGRALAQMLEIFVQINLFLAFFNLIPIPPLDGDKIMARFIPTSWSRWLDENQTILSWGLIILCLTNGFRFLAGPVFVFEDFLHACGNHLAQLIV